MLLKYVVLICNNLKNKYTHLLKPAFFLIYAFLFLLPSFIYCYLFSYKTLSKMFFTDMIGRVIFWSCLLYAAYYWQVNIKTGPMYESDKMLTGKTVILTGWCFVSYSHELLL